MKKLRKNIFGKKEHEENKTGTIEKHKPIKFKKDDVQKKYETWNNN